MSVAWRISVPPATAGPSTAAISGLVRWRPLSSGSITDASQSPPRSPGCARLISLRSAPAQNAPPAPVSTQTRMPGSPSTWSQAWRISAIIGPVSALRASGRFIVTIRTCSRRSMSACGAPPSAGGVGVMAAGVSSARTRPGGLPRTVTRSSFLPMALNFADLFEHAADVFGERTAVVSGERQVTYRELDERTNRLAHHLAGMGVEAGGHVGLYAHNSIEAAETLIAACKLRAVAININYRYTENELQYMFADADLAAVVCDRQFAPRAAAVSRAAPGLRGIVVIEDGSGTDIDTDAGTGAGGATGYAAALAAGSPARDFPPRSSDDVYIIYTGGTTGYPKGVMWRHEDIWRTLAGGIDFVTGVPLADEWEQSRKGLESAGLVRLTAAPLIHGAAQVALLAALFAGDTVVLPPHFDAREVWRAVERHQVNLIFITGDAMGRPLIEAYRAGGYDASSMLAISSSGALFSP